MCDFCKAYNIHQFANSKFIDKDYEHRITVAIVNGMYRKKRKTIQGRSTDYNSKGRGYELKYCPSCGKELRGKND